VTTTAALAIPPVVSAAAASRNSVELVFEGFRHGLNLLHDCVLLACLCHQLLHLVQGSQASQVEIKHHLVSAADVFYAVSGTDIEKVVHGLSVNTTDQVGAIILQH